MRKTVPTYDLYGENPAERPDFWLHCETIAARSSIHRWEIGLHRHEVFQQFLYIRKGSGDALLEGATIALSPPCVVALPPGSRHGFRFSRDVDGLVVTLIAGRLVRPALRSNDWLSQPRVIRLQESDDADYLDETFSRLLAEFEVRRSGGSDLMVAYLNAIVALLGRAAAFGVDAGDPRMAGGMRPAHMLAGRLDELVGEHFRKQLPAKAYAGLLGISPTHLNRIIRSATGMTVHDRIMQKVIEEARRALVFTTSSVGEVANHLGFSDSAYFSRCFRQQTGQTPSRYRSLERARLQSIPG